MKIILLKGTRQGMTVDIPEHDAKKLIKKGLAKDAAKKPAAKKPAKKAK